MDRDVQPELLDELPSGDARALRSRKDLRLINGLMGNERWILKELGAGRGDGVVELGAGAGELTRKMAAGGPVTGLDFQERPAELGLEVDWRAGDLFKTLPEAGGGTVVANLLLHHFEDEELGLLGEEIGKRERLVAVEPWRSRLSLVEGAMLFPLINEVTRHDMMVSIRAGFRKGELPRLLNLGEGWNWREEVSLLGGLRVVASRK